MESDPLLQRAAASLRGECELTEEEENQLSYLAEDSLRAAIKALSMSDELSSVLYEVYSSRGYTLALDEEGKPYFVFDMDSAELTPDQFAQYDVKVYSVDADREDR